MAATELFQVLADVSLRGGAMALLCLLAISGLTGSDRRPVDRYAVAFDFCAIAWLVETAPGLRDSHVWWLAPVRLVSMTTPAVFLVWSQAAFSDSFVPRWWRWLPFGGMLILGAWAIASDAWLAWRMAEIAALLLAAGGIHQALSGRGADLVEARRRSRLVFACGLGSCIAVTTLLSAARLSAVPGVSFALGIVLTAALLRLRAERAADAAASAAAVAPGAGLEAPCLAPPFAAPHALGLPRRVAPAPGVEAPNRAVPGHAPPKQGLPPPDLAAPNRAPPGAGLETPGLASPGIPASPPLLAPPNRGAPPDRVAPAEDGTAEERGLQRRLRAAMEQERAYREGGLTVASLADRLGVPEYRLRRLINQRLGFRNFVSYVNGYRLAEAMSALADPDQARVPGTDDRARFRIPIDRTVQPRLQGAHRRDTDRVPDSPPLTRGRHGSRLSGRFRNRPNFA